MEVDEKPSEEYSDIGGCDKQINELIDEKNELGNKLRLNCT